MKKVATTNIFCKNQFTVGWVKEFTLNTMILAFRVTLTPSSITLKLSNKNLQKMNKN